MTDSRVSLPKDIGPVQSLWRVSAPSVFMRKTAAVEGSCETELLYGEQISVYTHTEDWVWGQVHAPFLGVSAPQNQTPFAGFIGWVPRESLSPVLNPTTHATTRRVTALKAPVFSGPDIKSPVLKTLCLNSTLSLEGPQDGAFFKLLGEAGFIHALHMTEEGEVDGAATDFVTIAERHIGLPYIWGGISTVGLDCSGLVRSSLRAIGQDAPRDADQQQAQLGETLPLDVSKLTRGDLVYWRGHVGIMQDADRLIHANAFHMRVESELLSTALKRIEPSSGKITALKRL